MGTVLLIFLLLVLCGYVAYIGDLLGRRFGKKRLSVFGLRPKHTAILLTVATGVLIAAVTLTIAIASVPGFREVVTRGELLVNQNRRLASNNQQLGQENAERQQQNAALETRNAELTSATARLQEEKGRLTETNRKLDAQNETLGKENQAFQVQNKKLAGENKGLQSENKGLQSANRGLEGTNRSLSAGNRRLASANNRLQAAQTELRQEVSRLKTEAESFRKTVQDYREAAYVVRRDDEIERAVIPAQAPEQLLEQTVSNLVFAANQEIRRRNGLGEGPGRLIRLVRHKQHPTGMTTDQYRLAQWAVQQARRLHNAPVVVRVVADENGVRGRSVAARLECYSNDLVFRKDQQIAETRVAVLETSGGRSRMMVIGRILSDLVFFLQREVGPAATSREMIPSDNAVGELGYDDLLPVCERIYELGSSGRPVRVVARAQRDTLRAGPLPIWLDVDPQRTADRGR